MKPTAETKPTVETKPMLPGVNPVISCLTQELQDAMGKKDFLACASLQARIDTITGYMTAIDACNGMLADAMSKKNFLVCASLQARIDFMEASEDKKNAIIAECTPVKPLIASSKICGIRKTTQYEVKLTGKTLAEKLAAVKGLNSQAAYKSFLVVGSTITELAALNATLNTSNGTEQNVKMYIQFFEGKRGKAPAQVYRNATCNGVYKIIPT